MRLWLERRAPPEAAVLSLYTTGTHWQQTTGLSLAGSLQAPSQRQVSTNLMRPTPTNNLICLPHMLLTPGSLFISTLSHGLCSDFWWTWKIMTGYWDILPEPLMDCPNTSSTPTSNAGKSCFVLESLACIWNVNFILRFPPCVRYGLIPHLNNV